MRFNLALLAAALSIGTTSATAIKVCSAELSSDSTSTTVTSSLIGTLSGMMYARAQDKECASTTGTSDSIKYTYHATTSAGNGKCGSTAEQKTFKNALTKYFENVDDNKISGTYCLHLRHGSGTWNGWLKIGHTDTYSTLTCDADANFDICDENGTTSSP